MDPKVIFICGKLGFLPSTDSFLSDGSYDSVVTFLNGYAVSTAEDYIWRLHRFLSKSGGFPKVKLDRYYDLLVHYKALYT